MTPIATAASATADVPGTDAAPPAQVSGGRYSCYVLGLLTAISALSLIDRQLPFVMAEPIKRDLNLTDGQLGLIGGLAFSLFYTLLSLPAAHLADRFSRKLVVVPAVTLWSVVTAFSGLATSFTQLFISRIGVALGEAGCVAPSHSLIADYFTPERRALAMSIFSVGGTLGLMIGFGLGGWLADHIGWRATFLAFGAPGIIIGCIGAFTLREPRRQGRSEGASAAIMFRTAAGLLRKPTYRTLCIAAGIHGFAVSSIMAWLSPFLIRSHGMSTGEAGLVTGLLTGAVATVGVLAGGFLSDRLTRRDLRWPLWLAAAAVLIALPLFLLGFAVPGTGFAIAALVPAALFGMSTSGPVFATVQNLARSGERATASAIIVLLVGLVGGAGGPAVAGLLSDALKGMLGDDSLRATLFILTGIANPLAVLFFLKAASSAARDISQP